MDDMKKEDLSGLLSPISGTNSSTCGNVSHAQPQGSSTSSTLPYNAVVDVSPVEDNCNEETLKAPRVDALVEPPTESDNTTTHLTSNSSYEAVATKEHLGVHLDD